MNSFFADKKVFITGHTGFKGSWLAIWLHSLGARLTGYALDPPTTPSLYCLAQVSELMDSVIADVRDPERLKRELLAAAPDIVIHMAAQPLVRESYTNPVATYATNVMGTIHLLEAVRCCPSVKAVVNVTTDKCYENREWVWGYRETEPMGGFDPYSNSKGCSELVTAAYRNSFFNSHHQIPAMPQHNAAIASARAGNVIGGGDWAADRLIPDIIRSLSAKQTVRIRHPHAIRPWQHVLEPLSGYLLLARYLYEEGAVFAEGWNFGPLAEDAKPVSWIVQRMCELWGNGASYELDNKLNPHEAHYLKLDCSKAHTKLGWQPRWRLAQTIDSIREWVAVYEANGDMRATCLQQIAEYGGFDE